MGQQRQTSNKLRIMLAEAIRQIKENQVIDTRDCILYTNDMLNLTQPLSLMSWRCSVARAKTESSPCAKTARGDCRRCAWEQIR